jgi:hypothetical protein
VTIAHIRGDWMQTYTGRAFYPLAPHSDDIDPADIAHALSLLFGRVGLPDDEDW